MRQLRSWILVFVMFGVAAVACCAQAQDEPNGPPPRDGAGPGGPDGQGGPGGPGGPRGPRGVVAGFHLLPPFVADSMKLTADQKKQIAALEKQTKAKLYKILTAEQKKILEQARPPRQGLGGFNGGPGQGPGRRGQGGGPGGQNGGQGDWPDDRGGPGGNDPPPRPAGE